MNQNQLQSKKHAVAILGATGMVGQKAIAMMENHPLFEVKELVASKERIGCLYGREVLWKEHTPIPKSIFGMPLKSMDKINSPYILSALPAQAAKIVERRLALQGHFVFSNASYHRMDPSIPLVIPEVNLNHLDILDEQKDKGFIVTNPNCVAVFVALTLSALKPLGNFKQVSCMTMQAVSGAGYPGVSALDIQGNLLPDIPQEAAKIIEETHKILGTQKEPDTFPMLVHVNRVNISHGHTMVLHVGFNRDVSIDDVYLAFEEKNKKYPGLYQLYKDSLLPQPVKSIEPFDQRVHIGQIRQSSQDLSWIGMTVMGHNLVRGAAGAALLNMEAFARRNICALH